MWEEDMEDEGRAERALQMLEWARRNTKEMASWGMGELEAASQGIWVRKSVAWNFVTQM